MAFWKNKNTKKGDEQFEQETKNETKAEKEARKQKEIEEIRLRPNGKSVVRGKILGDHDSRTMKAITNSAVTITAGVLFIGGLGWSIVGYSDMNAYIMNNTTPAGTELTFSKSNAEIKLASVWTDKDRDLIVAKLNFPDSAKDELSAFGKNYNINILYNEAGAVPKTLDSKFGFLGVDGDAYLFLKGDFVNKPFQVYISSHGTFNKQKSKTDDIEATANVVEDGERIEKALREAEDIKEQEKDQNNKGIEDLSASGLKLDVVNFNINAYSDKTNVYDGSFLKDNGDIDYNKVVDVVSVNDTTKLINDKIKSCKKYIKDSELSLKEYEARLKETPEDTELQSQIDELKKGIDDQNKKISDYEKQLDTLENANFTKNDFGNMQTRVNVKYME